MNASYLTSAELSGLSAIRHGFFTRQGGVSTGLFAGLNCGLGSGDNAAAVNTNRAAVAEALGVAADRLISAYQCHSAAVTLADRPFDGEPPRVDAIVTATPGLAIGVLAADCGPVLFASGDGTVVGAAHAGWKGALGGVLENTVAAMEGLGARRGGIRACLGPCIAPPSYEMGGEVRDLFLGEDTRYEPFFAPNGNGRFQFDLPGFILHRLAGLGLGTTEGLDLDTYADAERFYSYRRTTHAGEPDYGRQISAIAIVP